MRHFTVAIIALLIPATALAAGECRKDRRLPSQPVDPTNEAHHQIAVAVGLPCIVAGME
jgi:hypothetical protein